MTCIILCCTQGLRNGSVLVGRASLTRRFCEQGALSAQLAAQNDRHSRAVTAAERRRKALHTCRPEDAVLLEKDAELSTSQDTNSALLMV